VITGETLKQFNVHNMPTLMSDTQMVLPVDTVKYQYQEVAAVLGTDELAVNSLHHQAIKVMGNGLHAVAFAEDGIVEGVELDDQARFVLGVQWHPEELVGESEAARRLFAALTAAARRARPGS